MLLTLLSRNNLGKHDVNRFSGGVVVELDYGHRIIDDDDPYVSHTKEINRMVQLVGQAGSHPIDIFPFCTRNSSN